MHFNRNCIGKLKAKGPFTGPQGRWTFKNMDGELKKTIRIAVTGGAASGKSAVCRRFAEKGISVINLDAVSKELMTPGSPVFERIVHHFGQEVLRPDGTLDRPVLRKMITEDMASKKKLESLVQPEILNTMNRRIRESEERREPLVVVEVPLLFELQMEKQFDVNIVVAVDPSVQIKRLMERDAVSENDARRLLDIQMPQDEKIARADIVIWNSLSHEALYNEIDRLLEKEFENEKPYVKST